MLFSNAALFRVLLMACLSKSLAANEKVVASSFLEQQQAPAGEHSRGARYLAEAVETSAVERQALVDLYYSTNGEGWTESENWLVDDPCVNQWYGVTCDEHGGLTEVFLNYINMTGTLEESIGNLFALQMFDVSGGQIGGSIPASIGNLKNVTYLALVEQEFEGEIPATVGNITKPEKFYGYTNQLEGKVPEFTKCENLTLVNFFENNLSGELPSFSTNINLQGLYLYNNNLLFN